MHLKVNEAAKTELRHMAEQGSAYALSPNVVSELAALCFAESNGIVQTSFEQRSGQKW